MFTMQTSHSNSKSHTSSQHAYQPHSLLFADTEVEFANMSTNTNGQVPNVHRTVNVSSRDKAIEAHKKRIKDEMLFRIQAAEDIYLRKLAIIESSSPEQDLPRAIGDEFEDEFEQTHPEVVRVQDDEELKYKKATSQDHVSREGSIVEDLSMGYSRQSEGSGFFEHRRASEPSVYSPTPSSAAHHGRRHQSGDSIASVLTTRDLISTPQVQRQRSSTTSGMVTSTPLVTPLVDTVPLLPVPAFQSVRPTSNVSSIQATSVKSATAPGPPAPDTSFESSSNTAFSPRLSSPASFKMTRPPSSLSIPLRSTFTAAAAAPGAVPAPRSESRLSSKSDTSWTTPVGVPPKSMHSQVKKSSSNDSDIEPDEAWKENLRQDISRKATKIKAQKRASHVTFMQGIANEEDRRRFKWEYDQSLLRPRPQFDVEAWAEYQYRTELEYERERRVKKREQVRRERGDPVEVHYKRWLPAPTTCSV